MKIISWNCQGKFREKFQYIELYDADIYVIQECENPEVTKHSAYQKFASNHMWIGNNKNKGLGIFAKEDITLKDNGWQNFLLRHFLSVKINDEFDILAVWAGSPYIEEYCVYQEIHYDKFHGKLVVLGDFNSNKRWDKKHQERNHTYVVEKLKTAKLESAYHYENKEQQGQETQATFFLHRKYEKSYHIDYAFLNLDYYKDMELGKFEEWIIYSDHMPLYLEMTL